MTKEKLAKQIELVEKTYLEIDIKSHTKRDLPYEGHIKGNKKVPTKLIKVDELNNRFFKSRIYGIFTILGYIEKNIIGKRNPDITWIMRSVDSEHISHIPIITKYVDVYYPTVNNIGCEGVKRPITFSNYPDSYIEERRKVIEKKWKGLIKYMYTKDGEHNDDRVRHMYKKWFVMENYVQDIFALKDFDVKLNYWAQYAICVDRGCLIHSPTTIGIYHKYVRTVGFSECNTIYVVYDILSKTYQMVDSNTQAAYVAGISMEEFFGTCKEPNLVRMNQFVIQEAPTIKRKDMEVGTHNISIRDMKLSIPDYDKRIEFLHTVDTEEE